MNVAAEDKGSVLYLPLDAQAVISSGLCLLVLSFLHRGQSKNGNRDTRRGRIRFDSLQVDVGYPPVRSQ